MSFVQIEFLFFFGAIYVLYWGLRRRTWQNALLVGGSAVFYGWVHPWFLLLLYFSAVLDFACGRGMARSPDKKKRFLVLSLAGNLGMLGFFKYCDFFIVNFQAVAGAMGLETSVHTLGIFLPVGISFYTFQTMSYTLDVYRGELEPRTKLLDYLVFVSFFPQLVAGPVERARNLLPQVERDRHFQWVYLRSGLAMAMWGLFQKICIADVIAPYVDKVFILQNPSGPLVWAATIGFSLQILADFAGYTLIARGTARMLGFDLMQNFRNPYLATSPSDFWRRWHISFSSWIRDYLYIPLGGSRQAFLGITLATTAALLLSGLWHGASWNFVWWGAYHAILITAWRLVVPRLPKGLKAMPGGRVLAIIIMYGFTVVGWLIFREVHADRLVHHFLVSPFAATPAEWVATVVLLAVCAVCALPLWLSLAWQRWVLPRLSESEWHLPVQTTGWAAIVVAVLILGRLTTQDFIYFQF